MRIGIPREVKTLEGRVALVPEAAGELVRAGHRVLVEHDAGRLSGYPDAAYKAVGAGIAADAASLYGESEMVVKVKEPQPEEWPYLRSDHLLFCYLHLAAAPELMRALQDTGLTAVAFETVEERGRLPLLAPMSDIAGRVAVQTAANLLYSHHHGKGLLLGGIPAAERGHVVVLGAGVVGHAAAGVAANLGARVTVFDRSRDKLEQVRALGPNVTGLHAFASGIDAAVAEADVLVGAVLLVGAKAPHLVHADQVRGMAAGSVIVDVSVDQGGCIETTRPTTYAEPTFVWEGVVHYGVTNMPGAVPRTASQALSAALVPYVEELAKPDWEQDPRLAAGLNVRGGEVVHPALVPG